MHSGLEKASQPMSRCGRRRDETLCSVLVVFQLLITASADPDSHPPPQLPPNYSYAVDPYLQAQMTPFSPVSGLEPRPPNPVALAQRDC